MRGCNFFLKMPITQGRNGFSTFRLSVKKYIKKDKNEAFDLLKIGCHFGILERNIEMALLFMDSKIVETNAVLQRYVDMPFSKMICWNLEEDHKTNFLNN